MKLQLLQITADCDCPYGGNSELIVECDDAGYDARVTAFDSNQKRRRSGYTLRRRTPKQTDPPFIRKPL